MALALILGFILGVAAILFILENTAVVALSFLQWQFAAPISLIVILSILVGIALALLMTLPSAIGSSLAMRRLRKHNEALAREADAQKQAADEAAIRLDAAQNPRPGVVDLTV